MIIIILLILLLFYFKFIKNQSIKYFDFGNKKSKIKICFLAGVHGNEPAGSYILIKLLKKNYFNNKNLFIRIIPVVNEFGLRNNIRYQNNILYPDINRNFTENDGIENMSKQLINLTKNFNIIIDIHEAWGFYNDNNGSIGSTITTNMTNLGKIIINELNKDIDKKRYKFVLLDNLCKIKSTFGCYNKNKKYMLIEISGQNDIQPIELRMNQIYTIIRTKYIIYI